MTAPDAIQRVFLTGGSGFVGQAVLGELLRRGYGVNVLVHRHPITTDGAIRNIHGGLFDAKALAEGMRDAQAVIHLVGIIEERPKQGITFERIHHEGTRNVTDAAQRQGVRRFVQMSANGVRADAVSEYHRSKWRAEEYLRASELDWTIFRPSMIHGPGGEFTRMLIGWARKQTMPYLFMPYFGRGFLGLGGAGQLQPIHVNDVARAFVDALSNPTTLRQIYALGGPQAYTWPQLYRLAAEAIVGKRRAVMPIPAWYARLLTRITPASMLPFNQDQVIMSLEDNTVDLAPFIRDFGWIPREFEASFREYAASEDIAVEADG